MEKIGLLSDAHGNPWGLKAHIRILRKAGVQQIYFLGDAIGYFPWAQEVLETLAAEGIPSIMGNHEAMACGRLPLDPRKDEACRISQARDSLDKACLGWICELPRKLEINVGGRKLLLLHGRPGEETSGYFYPDDDPTLFDQIPYDAVFMGHTHRPFQKPHRGKLIVNVGSCGMPRDGSEYVTSAVYNAEDNLVEFIKHPFNRSELVSLTAERTAISSLTADYLYNQ